LQIRVYGINGNVTEYKEQLVKWQLAGKTKILREDLPLSTKNLTWRGMGPNLGHHDKKPASNLLSYPTAHKEYQNYHACMLWAKIHPALALRPLRSTVLIKTIILLYIYVYLSNICPRSQLRIYWCYFSLSSQHVSASSGHLQVKYNYITYISWESYRYYTGPVVSQFVSYYLLIQW
jgi:hypothetical protein